GLLLSSASAQLRGTVVPPASSDLLGHVTALTTEPMEGRRSGTPGGERAARYIAEQLAGAGLKPGGDGGSFLQSFVLSTRPVLGQGSALERLGPPALSLEAGRDWTPHGGSMVGEVTAEIVAVPGPGGLDDYDGVDVRGKIVLALDVAGLAPPRISRLDRLITAHRRGAAALLIAGDSLPALGATEASVHLVSGAITRGAADRLLESPAAARAVPDGRPAPGAPTALATGVVARLRVEIAREDRRTANVVGVLPGGDPARAGEAVVLGAHYDHLGRSGGLVYPGADDNASGTSVVLGLARAFAAAGGSPRTLVFALFSGEEEGLLGSAHYARHPTVPMERTLAMLNFDMVGRMRDRRIDVSGAGSGSGLAALASDSAREEGATVAVSDSPYAASDHASFYSAGVPVLFFTTGEHEDYHTPRDTADKLDGAGMAEVARVAARIADRLASESRPVYVKLPERPPSRSFAGARGGAFLGVSADGQGESDGVRLAAVLPGTAAARAGLEGGDVIVRLGDQPVDSFAELRQALAGRRPGDVLAVVYLRDGEDRRATVTLGARP
ncbi:MAG TPA: M28 family peptidase, partial [Candidatus Methylomirabilis sp.]|nr:M28 family peptidase [Candidatus Methylomirabilis sp.]